MKALVRYFLCFIAICFSGSASTLLAQYIQANDEVSLFQVTEILNTPASAVRGVSDDGKRVVFDSTADLVGKNPDLNREIFVYEIEKRTIVQITNSQHVYDPADADKDITLRRILITVSNNNPAISGDGTKIVFSSNSGTLIPGEAGRNDDGNQEIYLATLPLNAAAATLQRVTTTTASIPATNTIEVFDNYTPSIDFSGSLITFISVSKTLPGVTNPDGLGQVVLYRPGTNAFTQVTRKNEADAIDTFFRFKGFNASPQLSGNGNKLVFISGFNHAPTTTVNNADFNGEIFLYDIPTGVISQVTNTTGFAGYPASISAFGTLVPDRAVNVLNQNTKHLSNDGTRLVFESAGDLEAGKNTDKTREVFLYNVTTGTFKQITTNSNLPTTPTQADIDKIDYDFTPGISPNGQNVVFGSILNIVPVPTGGTSNAATDNADGSREIFRYNVASGTFRQVTYTVLSTRVLDQREALLYPNTNATGTDVFFTNDIDLIGQNVDTSFEIYRAVVRPITSTSSATPAMVNAASFFTPDVAVPANNPIARGSIASIFGSGLANNTAVTTRSDLDFELDGVTVTVSGVAAKLFFVSPGQINFVVPQGIAVGDGVEFTINNRGALSKGKIRGRFASPGLFTVTQDGQGTGAVGCQIVTKDANGVILGTTYPAPPCTVSTATQDGYLLLFGTGFRFATVASVVVAVTVGETTTDYIPVYFGAQNFFPGLDQINLLMPADFPKGNIKLKIRGQDEVSGTAVESNTINVTIN